jgi:hypothetical protein
VPTLQIIAPSDGAIITPPTRVRYAVTGFELGPEAGHIVAFIEGVLEPVHVQLELTGQAGVAILPEEKLASGRRDVTFVLTKADGTPLQNPEARETVFGLTIQGGR